MSDIPEDLIADVLSRLPVETLLRFRCVSKQWCALIDSPEFINLQLKQSLKASTNLSVIFQYHGLFSLAFDYILEHDDHNNLPPAKLDYPLLKLGDVEIIGSCNGLICFYSYRGVAVVFLNPSTKKYQRSPLVPLPFSFQCRHWTRSYGFGYDSVNDDYKIVSITTYIDPFHSEVIVCSLRSNIWRSIGYNFPPHRLWNTLGVLFNGALHWLATREPNSFVDGYIVAFDLVDENFREVQVPSIPDNYNMTLGVSGGSLFMFLSSIYNDDIVELCIMKDYMVPESWTKLSIACLSQVYEEIWEVRILDYSNSSSEVLLTQINGTLCWLDLKEQKVVDLGIYSQEEKICVASLVKLPIGTNVL